MYNSIKKVNHYCLIQLLLHEHFEKKIYYFYIEALMSVFVIQDILGLFQPKIILCFLRYIIGQNSECRINCLEELLVPISIRYLLAYAVSLSSVPCFCVRIAPMPVREASDVNICGSLSFGYSETEAAKNFLFYLVKSLLHSVLHSSFFDFFSNL